MRGCERLRETVQRSELTSLPLIHYILDTQPLMRGCVSSFTLRPPAPGAPLAPGGVAYQEPHDPQHKCQATPSAFSVGGPWAAHGVPSLCTRMRQPHVRVPAIAPSRCHRKRHAWYGRGAPRVRPPLEGELLAERSGFLLLGVGSCSWVWGPACGCGVLLFLWERPP